MNDGKCPVKYATGHTAKNIFNVVKMFSRVDVFNVDNHLKRGRGEAGSRIVAAGLHGGAEGWGNHFDIHARHTVGRRPLLGMDRSLVVTILTRFLVFRVERTTAIRSVANWRSIDTSELQPLTKS